jgi:hypothetical protein
VTGLSDPQDIIDKFYFNEEIGRELKEEIASHKSVIANLKSVCFPSLSPRPQSIDHIAGKNHVHDYAGRAEKHGL